MNLDIRKCLFVLLVLFNTQQSIAMNNSARDWVLRMIDASQQLNYKGRIVVVHGSRIDLVGVVRKIDQNGEHQRIFSLNGTPRELIRKSGQLICYLPDQNIGLQGKLFNEQGFFPLINHADLDVLAGLYNIELAQIDRVAGRETQQLRISPLDNYRYGYMLWIDTKTGLLLKLTSIDENFLPLEQYMFSQVEINISILDSELEPAAIAKQGLSWSKIDFEPEPVDTIDIACNFDMFPAGYKLTHSIQKFAADKQKMMKQYVFSDGLSSFSVFVEPLESNTNAAMDGAYQLGSISVYSRAFSDKRVTMMGQVPQITAKKVAMTLFECK